MIDLNRQIPDDTRQRSARRQRFREHFLRCPVGMVDLDRLAEDTKIPWGTVLAYMRELHRLGYVEHKEKRYGKFGFQLDVRMWWKIK